MSSDGTYSGRGTRRADRDAPTVSRASAGAAVAILIITAILGFGGGAFLGNASGGEDSQTPAAAGTDGTGDTAESPDGEEGADGEEQTEPPGDGSLTLESSFDGGTAVAGEDGDDIEFTIRTNPPEDGLTVELERSLDGGTTWEPFGSGGQIYTLESDGTKTTSVWSGREGDNHMRVVEKDGSGNIVRESNVIVVTVVDG